MRTSDDIAITVRDLRTKLKLSQEELAQRLNVSFATVNRWENGKAQPQGTARDAIKQLSKKSATSRLFSVPLTKWAPSDDRRPRRRKRGTARSAVLSTQIHGADALGCRLLHSRRKGRAQIQGLHPAAGLHQTAVRRF